MLSVVCHSATTGAVSCACASSRSAQTASTEKTASDMATQYRPNVGPPSATPARHIIQHRVDVWFILGDGRVTDCRAAENERRREAR